ncbi:MAG: NAD-dependent epimerase/dehydratase family protein [Proteobacteria bacterium]|nr:NAD-dependent epimerase/dehydratase family protein [Pseudomonadota bacterium]MBS0216716.1 NAD-dependent epimerase/dehydratase family protein [Pseudomonadota bacterium]
MKDCILITGGAGFIGCAASHLLADQALPVVVLDNLHPQVHASRERPARLHPDAILLEGDVTDPEAWDTLLSQWNPKRVLHLAAETGTGQSLTEGSRHASVNVVGTTRMLDAFAAKGIAPEKIVLTSSRAVYGEGRWVTVEGKDVYPGQRGVDMLSAGQWDFPGLTSQPHNAECTFPAPTSVYGATKLTQEHVLSAWCRSFDVPYTTLRLQNVYGVGQSLFNSYTGIVSLFCRLARKNQSIPVYEDGEIIRDFVCIDDVARAVVMALMSDGADGEVLDVGTGIGTSIQQLATMVAGIYDAPLPHLTAQFRNGDVRAAWCEIPRTTSVLGWSPRVSLGEGVAQLVTWIEEQNLVD